MKLSARISVAVLVSFGAAFILLWALGHHFSSAKHVSLGKASSHASTTLSALEYHVLYEQGTEQPFTSELLDEHRKGTFVSADTGLALFRSEDKYESGTGWPSFTKPISPDKVVLAPDNSLIISRTEVVTADTHAHLGHVFNDGPLPLGTRYCMNGAALRFIPDPDPSVATSSAEKPMLY